MPTVFKSNFKTVPRYKGIPEILVFKAQSPPNCDAMIAQNGTEVMILKNGGRRLLLLLWLGDLCSSM